MTAPHLRSRLTVETGPVRSQRTPHDYSTMMLWQGSGHPFMSTVSGKDFNDHGLYTGSGDALASLADVVAFGRSISSYVASSLEERPSPVEREGHARYLSVQPALQQMMLGRLVLSDTVIPKFSLEKGDVHVLPGRMNEPATFDALHTDRDGITRPASTQQCLQTLLTLLLLEEKVTHDDVFAALGVAFSVAENYTLTLSPGLQNVLKDMSRPSYSLPIVVNVNRRAPARTAFSFLSSRGHDCVTFDYLSRSQDCSDSVAPARPLFVEWKKAGGSP